MSPSFFPKSMGKKIGDSKLKKNWDSQFKHLFS